MPGRPKMMAKRVEVFYNRVVALSADMLAVIPEQYRKNGAMSPEWEEELELFAMASQSKKIELYWRACIGHAMRLEENLEEFTYLLRKKAGLPETLKPATPPTPRGRELHRLSRSGDP